MPSPRSHYLTIFAISLPHCPIVASPQNLWYNLALRKTGYNFCEEAIFYDFTAIDQTTKDCYWRGRIPGLRADGPALWYLFTHPLFTNSLRDVSIIFLAITVIVLDVVLIFLMFQVIRLLEFLIVELKPVLDSVQESEHRGGTATFVSDGVTSPIIDASSKAAGVKGSVSFVVGSVLGGFSKGRSRSQPAGAPQPAAPAAHRRRAIPINPTALRRRAVPPQPNSTQETASNG